jgi:prevent-host-death family protein
MKTLQLREAKASLSAVVEAAERGEATTITKHGKPAAVVVPVSDARKLYGEKRPSFASLLMQIPEPIDVERDQTPMREFEW